MATSKEFTHSSLHWASIIQHISAKIPPRRDFVPVFSTIVFFVFSWAIYRFFYEVPSWLFYLNIFDLLSLAAYTLAFALIESFIIFGFILVFSIILPSKLFRDEFVTIGSASVVVLSLLAFLIQRRIGMLYKLETVRLVILLLAPIVIFPILILTFHFIFHRFPPLKRLTRTIADRMTVFSLLYIPLSILALLVVVFRNLLR